MESYRDNDLLSEVSDFARQYYSNKKYNHACRVAAYAFEKAQQISGINLNDVYIVALCHDLIEDTECPQDELGKLIGTELFSSVLLLTKDDTEDYETYCKNILYSDDYIARIVKQADMKDHIIQADGPQDEKVQNKYWAVLKYFL